MGNHGNNGWRMPCSALLIFYNPYYHSYSPFSHSTLHQLRPALNSPVRLHLGPGSGTLSQGQPGVHRQAQQAKYQLTYFFCFLLLPYSNFIVRFVSLFSFFCIAAAKVVYLGGLHSAFRRMCSESSSRATASCLFVIQHHLKPANFSDSMHNDKK